MANPLFLFITLVLSFSVSAQVTNQNLFDTTGFIPDHYTKRIAEFKGQPVVTGQIIFLGNSITEGGNWEELIGLKGILNRGNGGDITYGVLKRLDDITVRKPSKLFILIGINDIGKDIPDAVIADNVSKIIQRVKLQSPVTKIYLQSILPINPGHPKFPQHYDKEDHVVHTNRLLREVAVKTNVTFVNLYPLFLNNEHRLDQKFTNDGLHLKPEGYRIWVEYLKDTGSL
jgi:lysophospholipase L1-like esterase